MSIQPDKLGFIQYIYDKYEHTICINVFTLIIYWYMLSCIIFANYTKIKVMSHSYNAVGISFPLLHPDRKSVV